MGHLGDQWNMIIDPDRAELQASGGLEGAIHVCRPDGCGKSVLNIVGVSQCLVVVGESLDGYHWSEYLSLDDLIMLTDVPDHAGLIEEALAASRRPAGHHRRARSLGPIHKSTHPLELLFGHNRSHFDLGSGIPHGNRLHCGSQIAQEVVVDPVAHQQTGGGGAVLATIPESGHLDALS